MPAEKVNINGEEFWKKIDHAPLINLPVSYITGDGIPKDKKSKEENNLWVEWTDG